MKTRTLLHNKRILILFLIILSNYFPDDPPRVLPWTPKVRQKDLDTFLDYTRMKFVGFTLKVLQ